MKAHECLNYTKEFFYYKTLLIFIAFHLRKMCATAMSEDPVQNEVT